MKIKPGMFVRTKYRNEVVIRQIKNIFETSEHDHQLVFDKPTRYQYYVEDNNFIVKEKPIDLIEVGDYVNEYKVIGHGIEEEGYKYIDIDFDRECDELHWGEHSSLQNIDIKSIVTKEQFERESYKLGDD